MDLSDFFPKIQFPSQLVSKHRPGASMNSKCKRILSALEVDAKMEMSLCLLCDQPLTLEHQSAHKRIRIVVLENEDEEPEQKEHENQVLNLSLSTANTTTVPSKTRGTSDPVPPFFDLAETDGDDIGKPQIDDNPIADPASDASSILDPLETSNIVVADSVSEVDFPKIDGSKVEEIARDFTHKSSTPIQNQHSSQDLQIDLQKQGDVPSNHHQMSETASEERSPVEITNSLPKVPHLFVDYHQYSQVAFPCHPYDPGSLGSPLPAFPRNPYDPGPLGSPPLAKFDERIPFLDVVRASSIERGKPPTSKVFGAVFHMLRTKFQALSMKPLQNLLLFQNLVIVLEGDFLPRTATMDWSLQRESLLNMLLGSRKINYKSLMKDCMEVICQLHQNELSNYLQLQKSSESQLFAMLEVLKSTNEALVDEWFSYSKLETDSCFQFKAHIATGTVSPNYANILLMFLCLNHGCYYQLLFKDYGYAFIWKYSVEMTKRPLRTLKFKSDLVITVKRFSELACPCLKKHGVSSISGMIKTDKTRIAKTCGAVVVIRPKKLQELEVGTAAWLIEAKETRGEYCAFIINCKEPKACIVQLREVSKDLWNEVERNLQEAMYVARNILKNPKLLLGGATILIQKSSSIEGMGKWPYEVTAIVFVGMVGTLHCCDVCSATYHSRCISLVRMFMLAEAWYYHECKFNMMKQMIAWVTLLEGAGLFGKTSYGQYDFKLDKLLPTVLHRQLINKGSLLVFKVLAAKQLLLFVSLIDSEKFIPHFLEVAKSFKGQLLLVFVEMDSEDVGKPILFHFEISRNAPKVLAYTGYDDGKKFTLNGRVIGDMIKDFGEAYLADKLKFFKINQIPAAIVIFEQLEEITMEKSLKLCAGSVLFTAYPLPMHSLLDRKWDDSMTILHRKMIPRGSVQATKSLLKWKALPPKHGTWKCSSLRTRMF